MEAKLKSEGSMSRQRERLRLRLRLRLEAGLADCALLPLREESNTFKMTGQVRSGQRSAAPELQSCQAASCDGTKGSKLTVSRE